ncbi:hypothetical protein GDO81_020469 [Engystomops pustulosus]|uniref:Uncharacterized protein n=1 Tax=Engystomops pustulosus TaxID=76066 RepID=A0AAV6YV82_ENGPU|nr:hypothetical protein GDO81_020469 [Engystomops pustulosus]
MRCFASSCGWCSRRVSKRGDVFLVWQLRLGKRRLDFSVGVDIIQACDELSDMAPFGFSFWPKEDSCKPSNRPTMTGLSFHKIPPN